MKKISTFFIIAFLFGSFTSFGQVIISQIYEGASYNKFIEITNVGTAPVNLASPQLTIKLFSNKVDLSVATTFIYNLSGTLAPGQCYLVRHHSAVTPAYAVSYTPGDTNSAVANFNGTGSSSAPLASTDIVTLYDGTTLVDVFAWGTFQYKDQSFYRNAIVTAPNATWTVGEWTSTTNADVDAAPINTIQRLGYHTSGGITTPTIMISAPVNNSTTYIANVNVVYSLLNFVIPTDGHIQYKLDGGSAVNYSGTSPIALTGLSAGAHKVVLTLVNPSNVALVPKAADSVNFTVNLTPPALKTIYQIQYTTTPPYDSPLKDSIVNTSGVVTASYANGYFIQDGITPWNGLYVYDNTHSPALGDSIIVGGTISEYNNLTEMKLVTVFSTIASGKPLPLPIDLTTNTVKNEQYEGMLVKLTYVRCTMVNATGWWKVFQGSDTCEIGKLMFPFPAAVVGTYYDVTGCVDYYNQFMVAPRNATDISVNVGISETEQSKISLYPNPVTSVLNIANMEGIQQIKIANLLGEVVGTYNVSGNSTAINVNSLPQGIYFISSLKDNTVSVTRKFIKQ